MSIRNILIRLTANSIYLLRKKTISASGVRFLVFTGTSGKTLARSATTFALRRTDHRVVSPPYGYTNELGIVLAALGIESIKLFSFRGLYRVFFDKPHSESYACIELGADWYPDTKWFLKHFKPYGICLTNITKDEWVRELSIIWEEKNLLIKSVSPHGFVYFSSHNESLKKIRGVHLSSPAPTYEFTVEETGENSFNYSINNNNEQFNSSFAELLPYREAFGAALTCLHSLGVNIPSEDFFSEYKPVTERLLITRLTSGATLIADTYKAVPQCTEYVLHLARSIVKEKKIIILSEMRPIWKNKEQHYSHIASLLKDFTEVYFIGPPDVTEFLSKELLNLHSIKNEGEYNALVKKITKNADSRTLYVVKGAGRYHLSKLVTLLLTA